MSADIFDYFRRFYRSRIKIRRRQCRIKFDDVSFKYPGASANSLEDISFKASKGQTVAFIGPTGCGKTSLLNLIPRLYDASEGNILVDGVDVKDFRLKDLRYRIGYVPQKNILFTGTIAENINFSGSNNDIDKSAEIAQAKDFITQRPDSYNSQVEHGGGNFSGGQRQRIAIARALVNNPSIILADEPTGSLDTKTGAVILNLLKSIQESNNVTLIIVTHDPEVAAMANRTIKIRDGRIIEDVINNPEKYEKAYAGQYANEQAYAGQQINEQAYAGQYANEQAYAGSYAFEEDYADDKAQRFRNRARSLEKASYDENDHYDNEYYPEYETDYDDGEYVQIDDSSDDWIIPIHNEAEYDSEALDEYYSQGDVYLDYDDETEEELKEDIYAKFLDDIDDDEE